MLSTGIEALDHRLAGLAVGRYYLVTGSPGTGKSSVSLHFIGAGLDAGERCAILTQDDPEDLLAQAEFLGFDFRTPAEQDRLVVLQYRLDFAHNYTRTSDPDRVLQELVTLLGDELPTRFVIDSVLPFVDATGAARETVAALNHVLERLSCTTYLTVPGDLSESHYWSVFDRIRAGAAGIFHLEAEGGRVCELSIRKLRQAAVSTDPFRFVIRAGVGIVAQDERTRELEDLPAELRRRVVVLHTADRLSADVLAALGMAYDVHSYDSVEAGFSELSRGSFGALIVTLDPRQPAPAFDLTRELRKAGNGVPILFYSASRELRSSTRARGLRLGGDDFLTDDLSVQEFLERVEVARVRGHRALAEASRNDNVFVQPVGEGGEPLPLDESELRRAVQHQLGHAQYPFFALLFLRPPAFRLDETARILCDDLRVREGDLVATTPDGRLAVYLHDINRRQVRELLVRIIQAHPELAGVHDVEVYSYPVNRAEIENWLTRAEALQEAEAQP